MKIRVMPASILAVVVALVLFAPTVGSAAPLQSGALLTIQDSNGNTIAAIYDSQIHSGYVHTSNCDALGGAALLTDAYVLQGGSPTGCDNGDFYETTQGEGFTTLVPTGTNYSFQVRTDYCIEGASGGETDCSTVGTTTGCNSSNTICANPDTGFLTITYGALIIPEAAAASPNIAASFTGTITLTGVAQNPNGISSADCPPGGVASDSSGLVTLSPGQSVTLALSTDSSNCGGFTASQTATLSKGGTAIFHMGPDDFELAAANNAGGETLTFDLLPELLSSLNPGSTPSNTFNPGPLFAGDNCDPYASLSEAATGEPTPSNPVCPVFHLGCSGTDCSTFAYKVSTNYTLFPPFDPLPGPPVFLKCESPSGSCDVNIFLFYTVDTDKGGGSIGDAFFVPGYGLGSPQTASVSLPGYASNFFPPIKNPPAVNNWEEFCLGLFCPIPLTWQEFDANTNKLVTNPKFFSGGFCKSGTPLASCPANSVALQFVQMDCATFTVPGTVTRANAVLNGVFFNPLNDTFVVGAIPGQRSFDDTCQVLELIMIGSGGAQSTHLALFHFD